MKSTNQILNAFSIDVESFVESNLQSFHIPDKYIDRTKENAEIQSNMDVLLAILEESGTKATFFFVGRLAVDIPDVIRKVARAGHEIGCHSYEHIRVYGTEPEEFKNKLSMAKQQLEDISGKKIYGFRVPDFSITKESLWALDILKELGFVYDSSIYPIGLHDVYGIKDSPSLIYKLPNGLIEFPMSTIKLFNQHFPFGGGGYFRLYPLFLTRYFIAKINKQSNPCLFYIHPYEVGPVIPRISEISWYRKFRHYYNCKNGGKRLGEILKVSNFHPIIDLLRHRGLVVNPEAHTGFSQIKFTTFKTQYATQVARLHIEGLPNAFITSLGIDFAVALYDEIAQSHTSFGFVAEDNGKVLGFVIFTPNLIKLYKSTVIKIGLRCLPFMFGKIFSLRRIANLFETLIYPWKIKSLRLPETGLISIAVAKEARGKGLGKILIQMGFDECLKRGITQVRVLVGADNQPAQQLYMKCGFRKVLELKRHRGLSIIYVADLRRQTGETL